MRDPALFIVATPIGNLDDMTARAIGTLREVDVVAAEDTRRAAKLLSHFQIERKQLVSYHDHVEREKAGRLVQRMREESLKVALISDAGTPCISDPGYHLVAEARRQGVAVHPVPGASAFTALVSASGLPSDRVLFVGFLPVKAGTLSAEIRSWRTLRASIVFYEAPRRISKTFALIAKEYPNAEVAIGREMTKLHEEIVVLGIEAAIDWAASHEAMKGEAAVMLRLGDIEEEVDVERIAETLRQELRRGKTVRDLLKEHASCGLGRKELYQLLLKVKDEF